ncbi:prophage tail fiber N-terminal domain-containing protein [Salmonella enterica subsp. enterica]|nr:prophage tail fiber N-terminal domain-containing protein [Salmonella enterica subsp. enterica]
MNKSETCLRAGFYGGNMPVLISGVLWRNGTGTPIPELHHSAESQPDQYDGGREPVASENPDLTPGRYSMDVERGDTLSRSRWKDIPVTCRSCTVYDDSKPGT